MFRLMEKARKNNKGFSLVELIVVVLIIAIIAVALAPQVVKYVQKSRESVEANNAATIQSATQAAVAEYQAQTNVTTLKAVTYTVSASDSTVKVKDNKTDENTAPTATPGNKTPKALINLVQENLGTGALDKAHEIEIDAKGNVKVK